MTVPRRTFFRCLGAFLGGALAYGVHDRFETSEHNAAPYSGPLSLETVTVTRAAQHPENAEPRTAPGTEQFSVTYGETVGGVREIRAARRIA